MFSKNKTSCLIAAMASIVSYSPLLLLLLLSTTGIGQQNLFVSSRIVGGEGQGLKEGTRTERNMFVSSGETAAHDPSPSLSNDSAAYKMDSRKLSQINSFIPMCTAFDDTSGGGGGISEDDLLRAFKINIARGETPMKRHVFQGGNHIKGFFSSDSETEIINNVENLEKMLGIKGSLSLSYGPSISGSGEGSYLQERISSKQRVTILYHNIHLAYVKAVNTAELVPIKDIQNMRPDEIAESFGTHFVEKIFYGAQLNIQYTLETDGDDDLEKIAANLKGSLGTIEFSAAFESEQRNASSNLSLKITAKSCGLNVHLGSNPSPEEVAATIDSFNKEFEERVEYLTGQGRIDDVTNELKGLHPIGFSLGLINDYVPKFTRDELALLEMNLSDVGKIFYSSIFEAQKLEEELEAQKMKYTVTENCSSNNSRGGECKEYNQIFLPYKAAVEKVILKLKQKMKECIDFRSLPFTTIVKTSTEIPHLYPKTSQERRTLDGLKGLGYIESPVTVGSTTFPGIYYEGFTIPSIDGSLKPWLEGSLRHTSDDSLVARAATSQQLEKDGYQVVFLTEDYDFKYVNYNELIYVQSNVVDSIWMQADQDGTVTPNVSNYDFHLAKDSHGNDIGNFANEGNGINSYAGLCYDNPNCLGFNSNGWLKHTIKSPSEWTPISSDDMFGLYIKQLHTPFLESSFDRLMGRWSIEHIKDIDTAICVKYGDQVYIRHSDTPDTPKYLSHSQFANAVALNTKLDEHEKQFQWIIRGDNPKISDGKCIQKLSKVYLQANSHRGTTPLFLTGSYGNGRKSNIYLSQFKTNASLLWTLRNETEGSRRTDGFTCGAISAKGRWVRMASVFRTSETKIENYQTVYFNHGIVNRNNIPTTWRHTPSWESTIVSTVGGGFIAEALTPYDMSSISEYDVSSFHGSIMAESVKSAIKQYEPIWPDDFMWSSDGIPAGYECIQVNELSDPYSWDDNYFCWKQGTIDPGFKWSMSGQIPNMRCEQIAEHEDPHSWLDNYLCVPTTSNLFFTWMNNGTESINVSDSEMECIQWIESKDPHGWENNFLCAPKSFDHEFSHRMDLGQVWQYEYDIKDECVPSWQLKTNELVVTSDYNEQPCCLPGLALDENQPHGPCKLGSPCFCGDSVCMVQAVTQPPTPTPTSVPSAMPSTFNPPRRGSGNVAVSVGTSIAGILTVCSLVAARAVGLRKRNNSDMIEEIDDRECEAEEMQSSEEKEEEEINV